MFHRKNLTRQCILKADREKRSEGNDIQPKGAGTDTRIAGAPARDNLVRGNTYTGDEKRKIINAARAQVEGNKGFEEKVELREDRPLTDPNRKSVHVDPETWGQ